MTGREVVLHQPGLTTKGQYGLLLNGRPVFSVTKALSVINKPALIQWAVDATIDQLRETLQPDTQYPATTLAAHLNGAAGAAEALRRKASDCGSVVADWIHVYIKARIAGASLPAKPAEATASKAVDGILEWEMNNKIRWLATEWPMACPQTLVGGRADTFVLANDRPFMIDFKRVKPSKTGELRVYPEGELQVSGYTAIVDHAKLAPWAKLTEIGRMLLAVSAVDGAYREVEITTDVNEDWNALMAAARLRQRVPEYGK